MQLHGVSQFGESSKRLVVLQVLYQILFLCKFVFCSIYFMNLEIWVASSPEFIFALNTVMIHLFVLKADVCYILAVFDCQNLLRDEGVYFGSVSYKEESFLQIPK